MKITGDIQLPRNVVAVLRQGRKIEAIKLVRQTYNIGLAEAKAVIDAFEATHPEVDAAAMAKPPVTAPFGGGGPVAGNAPIDNPADHMPAKKSAPVLAKRATVPGYMKREGLSPGEVPRGHGGLQGLILVIVIVAAIIAVINFS